MAKGCLRLLVDVSLGVSLEACIRQSGHDAAFVRDIDPRLSHGAIPDMAVRDTRIVVTMDKDFGELVYRARRGHCGVLLLRMEEQSAGASGPVLAQILRDYADQLEGHFAVYQSGKLRLRK